MPIILYADICAILDTYIPGYISGFVFPFSSVLGSRGEHVRVCNSLASDIVCCTDWDLAMRFQRSFKFGFQVRNAQWGCARRVRDGGFFEAEFQCDFDTFCMEI